MIMTTTRSPQRTFWLNKVPEVTIWFWIIKILCTTVGESFADWINMTLGVGLDATALLFTAVLAVVLGMQFKLDRYVPFVYWFTVVVISVTGTLYTDILTDNKGVPLRDSSTVFAIVLAVVFGIWYAQERTLSIHSIVTPAREGFYWLAILVTFALGTAVGDWTLELTGWGPGISVLLPAGLIAAVTLGWRGGANPVLSFWLAYILTRPLGANLGDWFAGPHAEKGLGLGTAGTSVIFLSLIGATVSYLTLSKADVTPAGAVVVDHPVAIAPLPRQRMVLAGYGVVALLTAALLHHTSQQPHANPLDDEEGGSSAAAAPVVPIATDTTDAGPATRFSPAQLEPFQQIATDDLALLQAGNQATATKRITDLETAWDRQEKTLKPLDKAGWTLLDGRIDVVLHQLRSKNPDLNSEETALQNLIRTIG
jgi:uncharacterized membrane-anchored protein